MQNADVAQLVEQRFRKPQVVGSIPIVGSILYFKIEKLVSATDAVYQTDNCLLTIAPDAVPRRFRRWGFNVTECDAY